MVKKLQTKIRDTSAERVDKRAEELEDARRRETQEKVKKLEEEFKKQQEETRLVRSHVQSMLRDAAAIDRNVSVLRYLLGQAGKRLVTISGKENWEAFKVEYLPVDFWVPDALMRIEILFETTPALSEHKFEPDERLMICFPDEGWYECDIEDCEYDKEEIWRAVTAFEPGDAERIKFEKIFRFAFPGCDTDTLPDSEGSPFAKKWRTAVSNGLFKD